MGLLVFNVTVNNYIVVVNFIGVGELKYLNKPADLLQMAN
jgi:hypothetical protein